jgi:hypothetical protein
MYFAKAVNGLVDLALTPLFDFTQVSFNQQKRTKLGIQLICDNELIIFDIAPVASANSHGILGNTAEEAAAAQKHCSAGDAHAQQQFSTGVLIFFQVFHAM